MRGFLINCAEHDFKHYSYPLCIYQGFLYGYRALGDSWERDNSAVFHSYAELSECQAICSDELDVTYNGDF